MARSTELTAKKLIDFFRDGRRKSALLVGASKEVVKAQAVVVIPLGFEPITEVLQTETKKEWYQWLTRVSKTELKKSG